MLVLTECPRDAMQGIKAFVPTEKKAEYLNLLLACGFQALDFGSFVSPKAIPQMADTEQVLERLDLSRTKTKLLAIVGNERGAREALRHAQVSYLGFPFSISETFLLRNINKTVDECNEKLAAIGELAYKAGKEVVVYISMAFGNPYDDLWSPNLVEEWIGRLKSQGFRIFSLADTIGSAAVGQIDEIYSLCSQSHNDVELGLHLHSRPQEQAEKIETAYRAGCRRFDGALLGYGGCPMAHDDLVGNVDTRTLLKVLGDFENTGIDVEALARAEAYATALFNQYR